MTTQPGETLQTLFEREVAEHLVDVLQLEVTPEEIVPDAPLFVEGLGLDSIDALEVALMISRVYNVTLSSDDPDSRRVFSSLRGLATHVANVRGKAGSAG
ncbi:phosphopantetheine-binding protein [Acetobacter fallax]|uniref:Acyl carrier protein n=1 Tax=Acetobacter fallax TaxID=1737473 RepID=A0ABX0KCE7_9PROT|nr:phosphopantetheine-binding protein [Acetobacter fallax]NHO34090.1 acyl carrier protein [Acetobacter fallax]NHO37610.1 acyl carrier protein [Acetobacter fallax]